MNFPSYGYCIVRKYHTECIYFRVNLYYRLHLWEVYFLVWGVFRAANEALCNFQKNQVFFLEVF